MSRIFQVTADGGSRGNPGPAAYGATVSEDGKVIAELYDCLLYTSPSPRDRTRSRMPSSA